MGLHFGSVEAMVGVAALPSDHAEVRVVVTHFDNKFEFDRVCSTHEIVVKLGAPVVVFSPLHPLTTAARVLVRIPIGKYGKRADHP